MGGVVSLLTGGRQRQTQQRVSAPAPAPVSPLPPPPNAPKTAPTTRGKNKARGKKALNVKNKGGNKGLGNVSPLSDKKLS